MMLRRALSRTGAILIVPLAFAQLGANCVDGYTPDCSDPNIQCGPGSFDATVDVPDTSTTIPDGATDVRTDADVDADAGDAARDSDADGG